MINLPVVFVLPVYPVDVDLGVKPGKQHNVYRFTTKFSNGSTAEVCKTFQQLREFYEEVLY
jgi:hypothetical protein